MSSIRQEIVKKISYKRIKTLFDFLFAFTSLLIGLPFLILIALMIKLSSRGPILFHQERIGKNNKPFKCIKFRTMHPEAEDILDNLVKNNEKLRIEYKETHKLKNDPRITKIGKFLRKTSLDELPQLFNVLRMEMSIVGPRPIVSAELDKYGSSIKEVLSIKPGITGLWQVSGRNNLTYKKRVFLDCLYVNNINLINDIKIIIRTFGVILFPGDRGAY
tara:strand:+ start:126 stop:779 length:654 start_codon:yes stop_codon:yes gene_type:complete